jgi:hypothetical protein
MRKTPEHSQVFARKEASFAMKPIAHNGLVAGSSPAGPTNNIKDLAQICGVPSGLSNLTARPIALAQVRKGGDPHTRGRDWLHNAQPRRMIAAGPNRHS